jgi:hypothetical protein
MKINQRKKCTEQHNKNQSFSLYTNNSASYIYRPFFTFSLSNKQKEKRKQNNIGERVRKKKSLKRKQISALETNLWPESYKTHPHLNLQPFHMDTPLKKKYRQFQLREKHKKTKHVNLLYIF